jgi:hypothetical protein
MPAKAGVLSLRSSDRLLFVPSSNAYPREVIPRYREEYIPMLASTMTRLMR